MRSSRSWTNVTPKDLPKWTRISIVEPSPHHPGTMYFAANRYEMDDFAPYLYKTTDYGVTWQKIVDGIPPTEFTRAIREDLVRPGLLYAATERSMYISYDAGEHWQSLKRNLPPVAVHDIALRDDDIVIATMGRGFYAMEGIARLRQADHAASAGGNFLFQPGTTFRSAGTVKAEYWLAQRGQTGHAGVARREGQGAAEGVECRQRCRRDAAVAAAVVAAAADGGAPPRVTNAAGYNSFALPLRYPNGTDFRGAIYWSGNGLNGPVAAPGSYTVRMTVGTAAPETQPVRVAQESARQCRIGRGRHRAGRLPAANPRHRVGGQQGGHHHPQSPGYDSTASRVPERSGALASLARALNDSVTLVEQALYQTRNQAGEDPLNFPIRLNNQIGALSGFVSSGERRPPQQAYDVWNTLVPQLDAQLLRLKRILATQLPQVNAALRAAGQTEIVPDAKEPPAPPGGRGGRGSGGPGA